ncbi:J domain-containing protein [Paraburkholderia sp. J7]|uniref:J domain-containing protein n=1 Tax=Paraburkholderia sp. J7 TaxID=2805438 RepID=UPI002AB7984E|nr:J domain-containing protein [Paraburkholderia sp. J7]
MQTGLCGRHCVTCWVLGRLKFTHVSVHSTGNRGSTDVSIQASSNCRNSPSSKGIHTHYDNLKIARNGPHAVIEAAYRALSQQYHPDKNSHLEAARIIKILNECVAPALSPLTTYLQAASRRRKCPDDKRRPS